MTDSANASGLEGFVRETVDDKIYHDYSWKVDAV
jgi:hypothetical protein